MPSIIKPKGSSELVFTHQNGTKRIAFELWFFGGIVLYGSTALITFGFGAPDVKQSGDFILDIFLYVLLSLPIIAFVIWLIAGPTVSVFNRATQTVRFQSHKQDFSIPWSQINFRTQYFPTKVGVAAEFTVIALRPFPDRVFSKDPEKSRRIQDAGQPLNFGSFRVKNDNEAGRYVDFFNQYMSTTLPAEEIFQNTVLARPFETAPFNGLDI